MARFSGTVGFVNMTETYPGVFQEQAYEEKVYGDLLSDRYNNSPSQNLNDNIVISNRVSIVASDKSFQKYQGVKYVIIKGVKWKVTSVEIAYPRLILSLGGVYNEQYSGQTQ